MPASTAISDRISALERVLELRVCIHDHMGVFRDADGSPLLGAHGVHRHPACQHGRTTTHQRCYAHCATEVHSRARQSGQAFATRCWKGLREIVVPIHHEGRHLATVFVGTWRSNQRHPPDTDLPRRQHYERLRAAMPRFDHRRLQAMARMIADWCDGLLAAVGRHRDQDPSDDRGALIRAYIHRHAHRQLSLGDLAARLGISPSRCSHAVREHCGASFQDLVNDERLARAKALLQGSPASVGAVAEACGFADVFYFSRWFRRHCGVPPSTWRSDPGV